jgi:recombination protein RecA
MGQGLRKLTGSVSKSGVVVFFTNQIRYKIGVLFGNPETTSGGNALKFYASVRLDIRQKAKIKKNEDVIGNLTELKVVKNKVAPPYKVAETEIRYGEGVPRSLDVLLCGMNCGVVEKSGAWLNYKENRLGQGKDNAWEMLKNSPELLAEIEQAVRAYYGI